MGIRNRLIFSSVLHSAKHKSIRYCTPCLIVVLSFSPQFYQNLSCNFIRGLVRVINFSDRIKQQYIMKYMLSVRHYTLSNSSGDILHLLGVFLGLLKYSKRSDYHKLFPHPPIMAPIYCS